MITEKPSWIRHEGLQIFSIDIQPGGLRFATGGGDQKVRIWSMKSVDKDNGNHDSSQRLLATMRDHFGSVNCVRWAKHGRYLASGSDDQIILIHERKAGSGTSEFGSGEPPDVENWKVIMTLRGHTADVVDLSWSPDDSTLASGSLDNTVHVWSMTNGICTAVLRGHSSLVKGVTWDPIGSFIASQSDDKTVIIWRTSDWSLAHKTEGHWAKSLGSTFFRRLAWSPCGHFITTTHGFQKPRHSAPVLERGEWSATFDFLGHNAPVVVVKFNNSTFRKNFSSGQDTKAAPVGWANGASKTSTKEQQPYNVIAIGSQDRTITVWTTVSARPLFVAKHFFSQSVVDLSWSPDGYSLFACSLDGSVANFHFEAKELGYRLSDSEMDEFKRSRYGDVRGRQSNLAESPAQLLLEQASAKQSAGKKGSSVAQPSQVPSKVSAVAQPFQASSKVSAVVPNRVPVVQSQKAPAASPEDDKKTAGPTSDDVKQSAGKKGSSVAQPSQVPSKVSAVAQPFQASSNVSAVVPNRAPAVQSQKAPAASPEDDKQTAGPTSDDVNKVNQLSSPVKQREYRRPDGRKRIIPEAVGIPSNQDNIPNCSQNQVVDFSSLDQRMNGKRPSYGSSGNCNNCEVRDHSGVTARVNITESLVIQKASTIAGNGGRPSIEHTGSVVPGSLTSCSALSIHVQNNDNEDSIPVCLEAKPVERAAGDMIGVDGAFSTKESEIKCTRGTETLWFDRISGKVTVLAGNANFWAVGSEDGCLQVYTKSGRRAMPAMIMGSAAVFIDVDDCWKLLLVTRRGLMYIWDLYNRTCILQDSLASLVASPDETSAKDADTVKVISAKFSRCGSPLVVLASRHAFLYDMSLKCWLRIADDCFPASNFASSFGSTQGGELGKLQIDIGKFMARKPIWSRVTDDGLQTRAHLETQLAASLALKSAQEYRQCLLSYVRFLAREADESRLREVCESFLGPPVGMVGSMLSRDPKNPTWDPDVLGMKKHRLLREDILPSMASNRKVQRLLNEFMDILSEYEAAETKADPMDITPTLHPTTEASDKVMQPTAKASDKVMQPTAEANDKVMQPAEANNEVMTS